MKDSDNILALLLAQVNQILEKMLQEKRKIYFWEYSSCCVMGIKEFLKRILFCRKTNATPWLAQI